MSWKEAFQLAAKGEHIHAADHFERLGDWQRAVVAMNKSSRPGYRVEFEHEQLINRCEMRRLWSEGRIARAIALASSAPGGKRAVLIAAEIYEDMGNWQKATRKFTESENFSRALVACETGDLPEIERHRVLAEQAEWENKPLLAADHWDKVGLNQQAARLRAKTYEKAGDFAAAAEGYETGNCVAKARRCRESIAD